MRRSEAIQIFLQKKAAHDMGALYSPEMEVQVNVAQDGGERLDSTIKGRKHVAYSDESGNEWYSYRMPRNAMSEPELNDGEQTYDMIHVEAIGLTGWNFIKKRSEWFAYDFDAIAGHSDAHVKKLTDDQLAAVREAAMGLPYVTVRRSTSGKGLHLYVFVDPALVHETCNHTEHAAVARAILQKMSFDCNFDFKGKVDVCGGNMWIYGRKQEGTNGFELLKQGGFLDKLPVNWRDHLPVVKGRRHTAAPAKIVESDDASSFDKLAGQASRIPLDERHRALMDWISESGNVFWFNTDHHMLITHTAVLQAAHKALGLKGVFATTSPMTNLLEQNCFCFPLKNGAWSVRRYGRGTPEHDSWIQDGTGWTFTYLNKTPDLDTAARATGGIENEKGWFVFSTLDACANALDSLGITLDTEKEYSKMRGRQAKYKAHDGRIMVAIERRDDDTGVPGWLSEKKEWRRIFNVSLPSKVEDSSNDDESVRHIIANGIDAGWVINNGDKWVEEPMTHIVLALKSQGKAQGEVTSLLGASVMKPWEIVSMPFGPEYVGERQWNRNAAQLKFQPSTNDDRRTPTWDHVLKHSGAGLDSTIITNEWCKAHGVLTGADYLKLWIANLLQKPYDSLPYLFFYSPEQNTGKSTFHEALSELLTKGYVEAKSALTNQQGFNGELLGAVLCVVEELNINSSKSAADRIKAWVTGRQLPIHPKGGQLYMARNTTHWVQCANDPSYCPIFPGDTRITMVQVPALTTVMPKTVLYERLIAEAPDFIADVMSIELPEPDGRLNLPVIETFAKQQVQSSNMDEVQTHMTNNYERCDGCYVMYGELFDEFLQLQGPGADTKWTLIKFGRELVKHGYMKGMLPRISNKWVIGNIRKRDSNTKPTMRKLTQIDQFLREEQS